ncbi:glycosyltransferase family 4 protein [Qipengyuania sphaerica]|uniref:glycosyltransferase family 4 protein n=1 Tax=Qipengyuania sphaerica TaxID=2867243 RepID=UPI001C87D6BF|nr:glycosyltransferase family 4 protein [Qipengyuania sphaerica]MBX7539404.1 glycosyltransferase family 4 protein [Qipengyuania sphaerica]
MRISFVLPGLHRVHRGAEVAFEAVANEIANLGLDEVTLFGSGTELAGRAYAFSSTSLIPRESFERFPKVPPFRTEYIYEESTWALNHLRSYRPNDADVTVTCSYPFVNWMLTRWPPFRRKPAHIFVTQNGDWPAYCDDLEYSQFRCDGLICTNPDYYERNKDRWPSILVPNGFDPKKFYPAKGDRAQFDFSEKGPIVLMVSALVDSKRVLEGMRAVAEIPDAQLVVAGDGPLREKFDALGEEIMPGRFRRMTLPLDQMPDLYRVADVMLHPTFHESFGNVYVEALATGIPVVAHDYPVTKWIYGGDYPGLTDAGDEELLIKALKAALERGKENAIRRADNAVTRFAWENIAKKYREFLAEVHARHRSLVS